MSQIEILRVEEDCAGLRLDVFLAQVLEDITRSRIKNLCETGLVTTLTGKSLKASYRLSEGEEIRIEIPEPALSHIEPEAMELDILYEDADMLIINKPRGLVVHPAVGNTTGTLVNGLLANCTDLSGINGEIKPGIVHRIDKDTTGLLVVAKNDPAHVDLARQIQAKEAQRLYYALVEGNMPEDESRVEAPIGRDVYDRKRMAVVEGGRPSATRFYVIERFHGYTLLECALETGRTHQIRVHLKHIGHPVVGDPVYGFKRQRFNLDGQLLHAHALELTHPQSGEKMRFEAPIPQDFERVLGSLRRAENNY